MPENEKKNGVLSILRVVFKGKKEECADIVTQAEKVISDYICRRRNEIINKYCKKKDPLIALGALGLSGVVLYALYVIMG